MQNRCWYLLTKKLSGNATDEELSELDDFVQANPDWQYASQNIINLWEANNESTATDVDYARHLNRMESLGYDTRTLKESEPFQLPQEIKSTRKYWKRAGMILGPIMAIWLLIFLTKTNTDENIAAPTNQIVTKSGDRTKMILPDGSQVWLNAESKLEYSPSFGSKNRAVTLSGEAYFDVVKNTSMPFTIKTDKIQIKVTGTAFNVKAYPGEKICETSLIRGKVEVTVNARPDERYVLKPNEKLVVRDEAFANNRSVAASVAEKKLPNQPLIQLGYLNYIDNDSAAVETSWVYNRLIFDDESFEEIARKMERWYGVFVSVDDPGIAAQHLTYTIRNETVTQALRNMQYAIKFHYSVNGKNISITK